MRVPLAGRRALRYIRPVQLASSPRLVRFARSVIIALVTLVVTSGWTVAWLFPCVAHEAAESSEKADGCCPHARGEAADDDEGAGSGGEQASADARAPRDDAPADDHGSCQCPVDCGTGCAGMAPTALASVPAARPLLLPDFVLLDFASAADAARDAAPLDILHVPRA